MYQIKVISFASAGAALFFMLSACPPVPPGPSPMPPDATDAAGTIDVAPPPPVSIDAADGACSLACSRLAAICGAQQPTTCIAALTNVQTNRLIRAADGSSFSCACVASANSLAAVKACGGSCN